MLTELYIYTRHSNKNIFKDVFRILNKEYIRTFRVILNLFIYDGELRKDIWQYRNIYKRVWIYINITPTDYPMVQVLKQKSNVRGIPTTRIHVNENTGTL